MEYLSNRKAVLFDLDGTLLDTLGDLRDSVNAALAKNGFPARETDEIRAFVGNGIRRLIERAVPAQTAPRAVEQCLSDFKAHYESHMAILTEPYDGILPLLHELKARGMRLAVVSNKADAAVQELVARYFPQIFDCVCGERQGVPRKPAPDCVLSVMSDLQVNERETVYVGDSEVDIATARNAHLPCIAVTWGFRDRAVLEGLHPDLLADRPRDLLPILLKEGSVTV